MERIVIAIYQPKPGKENQLLKIVERHYPVLLKAGLVTSRKPLVLKSIEGAILEIFGWKNKESISTAHENKAIAKIWAEFNEVSNYLPLKDLTEALKIFQDFEPIAFSQYIQPKVTGIGGVFFKSKNPDELKKWYNNNLGMIVDEYGAPFEFRNANNPKEVNYLQWSLFKEDTKYFNPSEKSFMINYRVNDLVGLKTELQKKGVTICDEIAEFEYGKFLHILDPENNKIELWEPIDQSFTDMLEAANK